MTQIYLAVNNGHHEGWQLKPYNSPAHALRAAKDGETYGCEWKILKELAITVSENKEKGL